jgi:hypothetical protein
MNVRRTSRSSRRLVRLAQAKRSVAYTESMEKNVVTMIFDRGYGDDVIVHPFRS